MNVLKELLINTLTFISVWPSPSGQTWRCYRCDDWKVSSHRNCLSAAADSLRSIWTVAKSAQKKKKTSLRAGDQRQKQGSLWRATEVQKTTRLRWTRVNTRKNPASRSNELETFSDKVGGDVLGAFEVVGVKVLFHFQLRCQMMWDDVRWCEMTDRRSDSHLRWMWNRPGWLTDEQLC